jgi:hypothetical protein
VKNYVVYFTNDFKPTLRRTRTCAEMELLGGEQFKRDTKSDKPAQVWGVENTSKGKLSHVTTSRALARYWRAVHGSTNSRVVALG